MDATTAKLDRDPTLTLSTRQRMPSEDRIVPTNLATTIAPDCRSGADRAGVASSAVDFDPFADGELALTAPATDSQQEIWLGAQICREANLACLLSHNLYLTGEFQLDLFRAALDLLVERHESLRTHFSGDGTTILIAKQGNYRCQVSDLSHLDPQSRDRQVANHQQQAANEPFDLQTGSLFRVEILKLADRQHLIIFTIHHIICDGWSLGIVINELAQIYTALAADLTPELPPIEYFSEYAFSERELAASAERAEIAAYWVERFAQLPPIVDLPADRPRPPQRTFAADRVYYTLPAGLVKSLESLGAQQGCSLLTTLLAGFEICLAKLTAHTELVVGVPTSGQIVSGRYHLVGHCVNFLPLRSQIDVDIPFAEYLRSRNTQILDDYERQEFTFGKLLQQLPIPRDASRIPLVNAVFNLDLNNDTSDLQFGDLTVTTSVNPGRFATFELFVNGANTSDGRIEFDCQYNTNLYDAATIERWLAAYAHLLAQIVTAPDRPIRSLSLLTDRQRHQLLVEWNDTQTDYPRDRTIHDLFAECAQRNGDRVALVYRDLHLTYHQLNQRANQLAHYLIATGIEPGNLVGIALDRSPETIVAMLAILKVGAAYLPLDLSYPTERLAYILETAGASLLLTATSAHNRLPASNVRSIDLDRQWSSVIAQHSSDNPPTIGTATDSAYVMFTSGSTGQPKGVAVTHRGVVRLVRDTDYADFSADNIWLQLAPTAFDASILEIWGSLLNGAQLVLFPGEKATLAALGQIVQTHQITSLWLTAGLFHLMVDERLEDLRSLRQLIAGGDVLSPVHVRKVLDRLPNCQLINGYGPTENATFTCCYPVPRSLEVATSIPIGRPIANTQIYILDGDLQPVPIGIPGELYTGGDGLAPGYFQRPDLTAQKFIPNPFGSGKLYRTGDFARYLADGRVEFLGRIDNQVKIRGFRIELGEIETALSQHPSVHEVCVIDREDRPGDKRLVAYLVLEPSAQCDDRDLKSFLQSRLPDYAIPAAFVPLASLPLTANGKVDRRSLPAPTYQLATARSLPPRDEIEDKLKSIWQRVLGIDGIGIRDNFFELGGNSLMAVRLFAEIDRLWNRNLPLATLLQAQTIEDLATVLRDRAWSPSWSSLVPIQAGTPAKSPLFCIHPVGGNILEYNTLAAYLDADRPIYGLQSQGMDGKQPPLTSIEAMAAHYLDEIQTVQPQGPYWLLGFSFGGYVAYEMARQLLARGESVAILALLDTSAPVLPGNLRPSKWQSVRVHAGNLRRLSIGERWSYVTDRLIYHFHSDDNRDFLTKTLYDPEDLTPQLLAVLEANLQASDDYTAKPYPGKITLLRCEVQELEYYLYPDLGWTPLVDSLEIQPIPGPHYTMLKEPRVREIARILQQCLDRVTDPS